MAKAARTKKTTKITDVSIRMYCLGTGDCFVLKFLSGATPTFTMLIDCGSCRGDKKDFTPYLEDLATYVGPTLDLLVITHEHNDHVNGFAKCPEIFESMNIKRAWFAWTENPADPEGRADDLQKKRKKMRMAFANALSENKSKSNWIKSMYGGDFHADAVEANHANFMKGLQTLAEINLPASGTSGAPLAGMTKIKAILKEQGTKVEYLNPGTTVTLPELPGLRFHVLGPPFDVHSVYKEGKEGTDVYKKKLAFSGSSLAANAFVNLDSETQSKDIPFGNEYIVTDKELSFISSLTRTKAPDNLESEPVMQAYLAPGNEWRKIDLDWLNSAGSLALRLNSHINNTSLVLAVESDSPEGRVVLLPGDAEYGNWESWHQIKKWNKKGRDGKKHLVEDLLNRTVFYKVSHHLSFNGTALDRGISMMEHQDLAAMATLDRQRISSKWKSTMPNKFLLQDLVNRCKGKVFIMDEFGITGAPSKVLDQVTLGKKVYERKNFPGTKKPIYIQYTCKL